MELNLLIAVVCLSALLKRAEGSTCDSFLHDLNDHGTLNLPQLWKSIVNVSHTTHLQALNCRRYSPCKIELSYLRKTTLSICVTADKKTCFQLSCSCVDEPRGHNTLRTSDTSLKCMILKLDTARMYDTYDEEDGQNSLPCKNTELKDNRPIQNATVDPVRQKRDSESFQLLPLTVAFILGTMLGSGFSVFTILLCKTRKSGQNPTIQKTDLTDDPSVNISATSQNGHFGLQSNGFNRF